MKKKMLNSTLIVLLIGLVLSAVLSALVFETRESERTRTELQRTVTLMARGYNAEDAKQQEVKDLSRAAGGMRVTLIAEDGTVLAASTADAAQMKNHADRQEIVGARSSTYGVDSRRSDTTGTNMMYVATRLSDGSFLRVAAGYNGVVTGLIRIMPAMLLAALVALLVGGALADRMARSISAPLTELSDSLKLVAAGETTLSPEHYKYEELQDMASDINQLSSEVERAITKLSEERDRIGYLLDNMSEGLILLSEKEEIQMLNGAAAALLGCPREVLGKNIIYATRNTELLDCVDEVQKQRENRSITIKMSGGHVVEARISVVGEGIILVLQDVTTQTNAVRMRQEFFSSASHELKTPITSIRGFAELLCKDGLTQEQQKSFAERILKETGTMQSLIGDIIMISRLEAGDIPFEREVLDFAEIVEECIQNAQPLADSCEVRLRCETEKAVLSASRRELNELAGNLIQNAIRYNMPGGTVLAKLTVEQGQAVYRVWNSMGYIPPQYRQRVFERFFRIDKGRSKAMGGTGLGLAIVKHVANVYHATIELASSEENGTTFTVRIPLGQV